MDTERKRKIVKDKKKFHGAVDKSSLEQEFCKLDAITNVYCVKNLESSIGSYGRQSGRQSGRQLDKIIEKI